MVRAQVNGNTRGFIGVGLMLDMLDSSTQTTITVCVCPSLFMSPYVAFPPSGDYHEGFGLFGVFIV